MTQTKNIDITHGVVGLAVEVIRLGTYPVGSREVIEKSSEVRALVELGIARVNGCCLVRHDGSEKVLGEALRAQLEQNSAAQAD